MEKIEVIFLDWYKTVSRDLFFENLNRGDTVGLFESIQKSIFADGDFSLKWMRGEIELNDVVERVGKDIGLATDFLMEAFKNATLGIGFVNLEIPDLIRKIRKTGIKVVLASDNMDVFDYVIGNLSLEGLYDDMLLSNRLGAVKGDLNENNDSLFFGDYVKNNNLKYENCVLIDDNKQLVETCKILGMNNIRIEDCKNTINDVLVGFVGVVD